MLGGWQEAGLVWAVAAVVAVVQAIPPSVHFIDSNLWGNFFVAPGLSFNSSQAYKIIPTASKCSCRQACWASVGCVTAAVVAGTEGLECRLSDMTPLHTTLESSPDDTYFFWQQPLLNVGNYTMGEDKLLYLSLGEIMSYTMAREVCRSLPGHRLAMAKNTAHHRTLRRCAEKAGKEFWVDLIKKMRSNITWGDDTPYVNDPESSEPKYTDKEDISYFRVNNIGYISDHGTLFSPLCQANPLGMEW